jgi:hypothetical protein
MKTLVLLLSAAALGGSAPAFAAPPIALHPGAAAGPTVLSQAPAPDAPSVVTPAPGATTIIVAPTPPPAPRAETPPPPPAPTYVWDPGRWAWNGVQYVWQPGKYIEKPRVTATFVPGHWRLGPDGWVWTDSHWDYIPGR